MRPFESSLLILLTVGLVLAPLGLTRRLHRAVLPSTTAAVLALHLLIEGHRWQMWPAYVLSLLVWLSPWHNRRPLGERGQGTGSKSWLWAASGIVISLMAACLPVLLPVPELARPSGKYPVGTVTLHLVDPDRADPYAANPQSRRELMVQVWYPASSVQGIPAAPWVKNLEVLGPEISKWLGLPSFFLDHVGYARTHAYPSAPLEASTGPFPVLLFSHGYAGFRAQNSFQMQELASHGYIVAAAEHTYAAIATVFPDGRTALQNPATLPSGQASRAEFESGANQLLQQWTADLAFILDHLEKSDDSILGSQFFEQMDLERVGVLGHSTGGGAAVEFCGRDLRCDAGLAMDAWLQPVSKDLIRSGVPTPFLYFFSETWSRPRNQELFSQLVEGRTGPSLQLVIAGSAHYDFTDLPALSPLAPALGLKGPINGARVQSIINQYSVAFFDHFLRGTNSQLLVVPAPDFPEVQFRRLP